MFFVKEDTCSIMRTLLREKFASRYVIRLHWRRGSPGGYSGGCGGSSWLLFLKARTVCIRNRGLSIFQPSEQLVCVCRSDSVSFNSGVHCTSLGRTNQKRVYSFCLFLKTHTHTHTHTHTDTYICNGKT